eukprot:jgi/Ulvmu1/6896/UM031_0102.1
MDLHLRSTTFEVPFKAILDEPGVNWFRDAVPTCETSGNRRIAKTHGSDDYLAAVHRDQPTIGLVCPKPAADQSNGAAPVPCSPPVEDANSGDDSLHDVFVQIITPDEYRTYGVYKDDCDEACLVLSVHKSVFSTGPAASKDHATVLDVDGNSIKSMAHAHTSNEWARFLLYSEDLFPAHSNTTLEVGNWCLIDEGRGNFLEAGLSPNLQHVQVLLTRSIHIAMGVPYSDLMRRSEDEDCSESGFNWLHQCMMQQAPARMSAEPRLLFGPARHPLLAAIHHDRPTIAFAWPAENGKGERIETEDGRQLVDTFIVQPELYETGGVWYDESLQACLPCRITFHERDRVDKRGWRVADGGVDAETGVVLLYPRDRVEAVDAIKEWGDWALVDNGRGVGLMAAPAQFPDCRFPPVLYRPLPWGMQRCW